MVSTKGKLDAVRTSMAKVLKIDSAILEWHHHCFTIHQLMCSRCLMQHTQRHPEKKDTARFNIRDFPWLFD